MEKANLFHFFYEENNFSHCSTYIPIAPPKRTRASRAGPKDCEDTMTLHDILTDITEKETPILLNDGTQDWEASALLATLAGPQLKRNAHMQTGLYIAEINDGGYLGRILYRLKNKA